MKRTKKLITAILLVSLIFSALPFSLVVSAEEKEDISMFTDVKKSDYFYDAVNWAYDNAITEGVTETKFGPSQKITRAQAVVFLYRFSGSPEVTGDCPFEDVPADTWFTDAVLWASQNGITNGVSATKFNPGGYCTRGQIVSFLYRYVLTPDVSKDNTFKDVAKDAYYFTPVSWAVENGITDGVSPSQFNPNGVCQRAHMVTFLYRLYNKRDNVTPIYSLLINDKPLDDTWVITYDEGNVMENAAKELKKYLAEATGITLEIVDKDSVGESNRFYIKNETIEDEKDAYTYKTDEKGVVIAGSGLRGAIYGVYNFLEDEIGWHFVANDTEGCDACGVLNLKDLDVKYTPFFRIRDLYVTEMSTADISVKRMINGFERRHIPADLGGQEKYARGHTMANLSEYHEGNGEPTNPCMYDDAIYANILKNVKSALSHDPEGYVAVCQNDTQARCRCSKCVAMEEYYESGAGPLIEMLNKLSDDIVDEYPNAHIVTYAYQYTRKAPKNIVCRDNIVIEFCPIDACQNHSYGDPDCEVNAQLKEDIEGWGRIAKAIGVYDYGVTFLEHLTPFPNFDVIRENIRFVDENNAISYLSLCLGRFTDVPSCSPEFGALRSYLYSIALENPYMSDEEYEHEIDVFCRYYYGRGWKYVRKFIDFIHDFSNELDMHFSVSSYVEGIYGQHPFTPYNDQLVEWFDKAEALAQNDKCLGHVQRTRICCDYVRIGSIFLEYYQAKGEKREYVISQNKLIYDRMIQYDVRELRDGVELYDVNFNNNPRRWIKINPYKEKDAPPDPSHI